MSGKITRVHGDLFKNPDLKTHNILIPHVCNDKGAWGSGFVVPLGKHYPKAKERYMKWWEDGQVSPYFFIPWKLGQTQFVECGNITVCNMLAQTLGGNRPLKYNALVKCMDSVACVALARSARIYCPLFGCGLAGGSWTVIREFIKDCWLERGIDVTIFYLDIGDFK